MTVNGLWMPEHKEHLCVWSVHLFDSWLCALCAMRFISCCGHCCTLLDTNVTLISKYVQMIAVQR
jgi:hypothetical protein